MNWSRSWSKVCDSDRIVPSPSRSASGPWCWVGRSVMFLFDFWLAGWPFISNPGYWTVDRVRIAVTWVVRRLRRREKSTKPYHIEEGEVVTRFPLVNLRKDHCRTLETERPENDETSLFGRPVFYCACRFRDRTHSFRISPNPGTKSVKENTTKQPAFTNPETVFVRKQCCNVKYKTTLGNGYLGSRIDEERRKM
ncbi:hypothetical protein YC2023_045158 [Brassica napus]